ncbi:MAG: hypothetical protein IJU76_07540 [Desulfovibrionaceae bacterium]|nr:hypothetical protein [Desulfovibrionaceae bacterium]
MQLLQYAPNEIRQSVVALLPAVKRAFDLGYHPVVLGKPIHGWRCLLTFLASLASMQSEQDALLRVSSDLLAISDHMAPPEEVLRQSGNVLVKGLHADFYICRMRTKRGEWKIRHANAVDSSFTPILAPILSETLVAHPLMRAVLDGHTRYIVSNNLLSLEEGGDAYNSTLYHDGYRSRLAFILRDRCNRPPFGIVALYSKREAGFDSFEEYFLTKYAKIVSLSVGRRIAVARDTLRKAAGGMAHYGNNILHQLRITAEYCDEIASDIDDSKSETLALAEKLRSILPKDSQAYALAERLCHSVGDDAVKELQENLAGTIRGTKRMERIIQSLEKSVDRPRLVRYVKGCDVLRLDDGIKEECRHRFNPSSRIGNNGCD